MFSVIKCILCLYFIATGLLSFVAVAKPFQSNFYHIHDYPTKGAECDFIARDLGVRFGLETGAHVLNSRCNSYGTIAIEYEADAMIPSVSTVPKGGASFPLGLFADEESCLAAMSAEETRFKDITGLNVFVSFCMHDPIWSEKRWILQIDGLGTGNTDHFVTAGSFIGKIQGYDRASFQSSIKSALSEKNGLEIRDVSIASNFPLGWVIVHYYASTAIRIDGLRFNRVQSYEQCEVQRQYLDEALALIPEQKVLSYCTYIAVGSFFETSAIVLNPTTINTIVTESSFDSLDLCNSGRASMIDFYKNDLGINVIGAVCSENNKEWSVQIIESRM